MNTPVRNIPAAKQTVAMRDDLCISFSTIFPRNAADIPRKKIAKENAHSVAPLLNPI
jgi:hypothetical protein